MLRLMRPSANSEYNCISIIGLTYVTRLCLGLSHLHEHKFWHSFFDLLSLTRGYAFDIESTCRYQQHCPTSVNEISTLLDIFGYLPFMSRLINPQRVQAEIYLLHQQLTAQLKKFFKFTSGSTLNRFTIFPNEKYFAGEQQISKVLEVVNSMTE